MIPQHVLDSLLIVELARASAVEADAVADEAEDALQEQTVLADDARDASIEELRLVGLAVDDFLEVFNAYIAEVNAPETTTTTAP